MPAELELTTSYYLVLSALMFAIGATGLPGPAQSRW